MFKPIIRMAAAILVAGVIALAITAAPAARASGKRPGPSRRSCWERPIAFASR